ncbi:DNA-directed RNA polymerase, subunit E'' [Candidatus Bathyarchaeota archaeon]|nr:DNA-directed RNA polymerase, subunit E'' [Candidatus Bathyarchaeota archaeon]
MLKKRVGWLQLVDKACRSCKLISSGPICPNCKSSNLSEDWSGIIIIINPELSEIAKKLNIKTPGRYAIRVR